LPVNSKRVKGFDDGEVNKQSVTKIKFIKGARPGLKRPAQVTVQQMQKKDLNMKRRKDLNGFSTQNGAKVVPG
jgi:hypothetical protein